MILTIVTLILAAAGFVWGRIRSDIVALIAIVVLTVGGILTPGQALAGFSNSIVIMMVGLFVVGGAIFNTGLAKMLGSRLLKLGGGSSMRLLLVVVIATAVIGGFVSNTGTVALMLPIIVGMAAAGGLSASRFLMPVAFASSIGGMLTLIGTPPNLVIAEAWENFSGEPITMFTILPLGLVCLVAGTLLLIPMSKMLAKKGEGEGADDDNKGRSLLQIVEDYNLNHDLWIARVPKDSPIAGLTLGALALRSNYGLDVYELREGEGKGRRLIANITQKAPEAGSTIDAGDTLFLRGPLDGARRLAAYYGLVLTTDADEVKSRMKFYDIGLAEIIPLPESGLLRETIGELDFRNRYNVNVLAVRRGSTFITEDLRSVEIRKGDVLLVQGTWDAIGSLSAQTSQWMVLGQPESRASQVTLDYKAPIAAIIMIAMVVGLVVDVIPAVMTVLIAAILMILTGCFRNTADAYKTINWESIVLIAAMMPMSTALDKTGISAMVSTSLVDWFGSLGPHGLMAAIYFTTSIMSLFISNTATAVLLAPIAVASAVGFGVSPLPMLFAVTFGASLSFASPFSTPPNALVMSAGRYTFMDYVRIGAPLQILLGILMIFVIPLFFPF